MEKTSTKSSSHKKTQKVKNSFISMFVIVTISLFVLFGVVTGILVGYINNSDSITPDELILKGFTTNVYDYKENLVSPLNGDKNRVMVDLSFTPKDLREAFIAIEDKRFYNHPGIDIQRIAGAAFNYLQDASDRHGASTITQQVVRNLTGNFERTFKRKIQEQWKALELERHLTKDQIMELYMNIIYMGHNCYGVQSASILYFGKDVSELTLSECAALAGITNAPSIYDPFTKKGVINVKKRQEVILAEMNKLDYISIKDYEDAIKSPLKFQEPKKNRNLNTSVQSYFIDQVVIEVKKGLIQKGYSEELALKMIYNNGLKIYTTLDTQIQKAMDDVYTNDKQYFSKVQKEGKPQSAMVILDAQNSQIRAMYGGSGVKIGSIFNRASSMTRQPGSTFKPIAVYAPAIDQRKITAATVIDDVPVYLDGIDKPAYPTNYDLSYSGLNTIRSAVKKSLNVVAAKVWTTKNLSSFTFSYLAKVNINRENETYVSTALGGLYKGVNPIQMAAAYVPFVNKGVYFEPITVLKVEDSKGKIILENKIEPKFIYEDETAFIMTDILSEVVKFGGTASGLGQLQNGNMPTAGKTGTTSSNYDKWFVGYSPYYVGATWYGYDSQTTLIPMEYNRALSIWHDVMEKAHKNLPQKNFAKKPLGVVEREICIYSGKMPSQLCSSDPRGDAIRREYFIKGTEPTEYCDVHYSARVCADSNSYGRKQLVTNNCPASSHQVVTVVKRNPPYSQKKAGESTPRDLVFEMPNSFCTFHSFIAPQTAVPQPEPTTDSVTITTPTEPEITQDSPIIENNIEPNLNDFQDNIEN